MTKSLVLSCAVAIALASPFALASTQAKHDSNHYLSKLKRSKVEPNASSNKHTKLKRKQRINLNTADASSIAGAIKGVGIKRAQAIVAYRKQHGPFKSFSELSNIRGISKKLITKNAAILQQTFTLS